MAYNITRANGTNFLVLNDNVINRDYSITFVGKMVPNYGQAINTNFLRILENSASSNQPLNPVPGQLWYDSSQKRLKFYTGTGFHTLDSLPPNTLGVNAYLSANPSGDYFWVSGKTLKNNLFPSTGLGGISYDQITLKGCIATSANLPSTGAQIGDLYIDQNCKGDSWVYNGCSPDSATCVRGFFNAANQTGYLRRNADGTTSYVDAATLISEILPAGRNNQILFNLNKGITSSPKFTWDGTQLIVDGKIYTTGTNNGIAPGAAGSRDLKKYIDDFDYNNADPKAGVLSENRIPTYSDFKFSIGQPGSPFFALSLERNFPTMFYHTTDPLNRTYPYRAFKFNEQSVWIFDNAPMSVNFSSTLTERLQRILNMNSRFAYVEMVDDATGNKTRRVLVKTNNSGKPGAWSFYRTVIDYTTTPVTRYFDDTDNLFLYINPLGVINKTVKPNGIDPDDRILALNLTDPITLKVYSVPYDGTSPPVLLRQQVLMTGSTDVATTDQSGAGNTNNSGYTTLPWGYNAYGICNAFTWNKFTEQLLFVGVGYGYWQKADLSLGQGGFGATISWRIPLTWMLTGAGTPENLIPLNPANRGGKRYNFFQDDTWNSSTGGMTVNYFNAGEAVGVTTDENSRYISVGKRGSWDTTTLTYYKWSADKLYSTIGREITAMSGTAITSAPIAPTISQNQPILDEAPWSKWLYGNAGFIIGSNLTAPVYSSKHGNITVSTDFSAGSTGRFLTFPVGSTTHANNTLKLNVLDWENEYTRPAFTSTVLASPMWPGAFSYYHTGTTVKSDGTPVYYIAAAGRRLFTVQLTTGSTAWDFGLPKAVPQKRVYIDAGIDVPPLPATISTITNIVSEQSCIWNGDLVNPIYWHIVRGTNPTVPVSLAGTGTLNANKMCYIAKCVNDVWSNIYGPLLISAINVGNTTRTTNANDWYIHNGSHLLTQSGIIMHPGIIIPIPGDSRFYYLRFNTNTNSTVTEGTHPLIPYTSVFSNGIGHYGASYGYSTVLGYYQMIGNYNIVTATIRSSRDVTKPSVAANAGNPDYTEAQWVAGSGYTINAICNGQTGLSVAIKPYPMYIGGYQTNVAETLLPLLPNRPKQNIYVLKTDNNRLSNTIYASVEDEPVGFTKQLIATVVTDDEKVTDLRTFSIGISIPPNDSGTVRYLSNVDGECGWVTAGEIVGTGGGVTTGYTLPTASTTVLGGVKVDGSTIKIDATGAISASVPGTGPIAKLNFSTDPLSPALTVNLAVGANVARVAGSTVGRYLVTFTTARADANYVAIASLGFNASNSPPNTLKDNATHFILNQTASGFEVYVNDCHGASPIPLDTDNIGIVVFA
jgi:hypothetical protein